MQYFNNACVYCGLLAENHYRIVNDDIRKESLHKEHVDHEGSNNLSNCVPSCLMCNSEKHKSTLDDWYNESNPKYSKERYAKIVDWITKDYKKF